MAYRLRFMAARQARNAPSQQPKAGFTHSYYGNERTHQIRMPGYVIAACHEDCFGNHELHAGFRMRDQISAAINIYWQRLHLDAACQLELGEAPKPFDADAFLKTARESMKV